MLLLFSAANAMFVVYIFIIFIFFPLRHKDDNESHRSLDAAKGLGQDL